MRLCSMLALLVACDVDDDDEDTGVDIDTETEVDSEIDTEVDTDAVVDCSATLQLDDGLGGCREVRVFLLDDSPAPDTTRGFGPSSGPAVIAALQAEVDGVAGVFSVTNGGYAPDWDGAVPTGTDVVFWAQGVDYSSDLSVDGMAGLSAFVTAGGGLVRTEWGTGYEGLTPELSPISSEDRDYFEGESTWSLAPTVPEAMVAVVAHLPSTFTLDHGMTEVVAAESTVTLATIAFDDGDDETPMTDVPALVVQPATATAGTVVFVNHDLLYSSSSMTEPEVAPLFQSATWAAAAGL